MDKNVQFEIENYFIFFENNANVILSLFRATRLSILSFVGFELFIHLLSKSVVSKRVVSLNAIFSNKGSIFYDLRMEKENRNTSRDTEDINSCVMISVHCYRVGIQFTALIPLSVKRTFFITIRVILNRIICHYSLNPFFFLYIPLASN